MHGGESFSYNYPKVSLTCGECQRCVGLGTHTGVELNHCCIQPLKTKFTYQHDGPIRILLHNYIYLLLNAFSELSDLTKAFG